MKDEFKRKVVKVIRQETDRSSISSRGFSWSAITTHTVIAECGHSRIYRGSCQRVPKTFSPCKDCQNGVAPKPVEGPLGKVTEERAPSFGRMLMEAIVDNEREKARASR